MIELSTFHDNKSIFTHVIYTLYLCHNYRYSTRSYSTEFLPNSSQPVMVMEGMAFFWGDPSDHVEAFY